MKIINNKTLFIFDWDGTLMDSIGLIVESIQHAANNVDVEISDSKAKSIIGLSLEKGIELLFPEFSADEQKNIITDYANYYIAKSSSSPLFDGIADMVLQLHNKNKKLAVATGKKRAGLERVFEHSGIKHLFVSSRCADESGSKPNPNMLNEILAETGCNVKQAIFVGDSIHDIQMANAINMDSIAVNYGCETADVLAAQMPTHQVNTPAELIDLLLNT